MAFTTAALVVCEDDIDNTGLVASPAQLLGPDTPLIHHLPLKFWENSRNSPLKPRRKDLHETTLLNLLGHDFDSRWMKSARLQDTKVLDIFTFL